MQCTDPGDIREVTKEHTTDMTIASIEWKQCLEIHIKILTKMCDSPSRVSKFYCD